MATATPDLPRAADLPPWMGALRDRFLKTDTSQFVLHGNVHDLSYCAGRIWSMPQFLDAFFAPSDKLVVHYDPGRGIWFPDDRHAARAGAAWAATGFLKGATAATGTLRGTGEGAAQRVLARQVYAELGMERNPAVALAALEHLLISSVPTAVVVHYAELVAPDGSSASLGFDDRTAAAQIHRWSLSDDFAKGDNLVLLLTSALPDLARRITRNPRVGVLHVPLPGPLERARFLAHTQAGLTPERGEKLTRVTAGLQLRQIQDLMGAAVPDVVAADAALSDPRQLFKGPADLPMDAIAARKKSILEQECHGLIEVLHPDHGFDVVGGMEPIKEALTRIAGHVRAGRTKQVPMGILLVGPMGTGKSFLAEAFAKESGLAAVRLKNFRDKWVGSTEANLEKVLDVIEGLGEILVIVDEGDRSIGGAGDSDGGVNSRVIARLKEFMSEPSHRGRIIFVMMTNRPDKLDVDMKRPGRFDLKIPFFAPQNAGERLSILKAVFRRHRIDADLPEADILALLESLDGYAAADLEAVALLAYDDLQSGILPEGVTTAPEKVTVPFVAQALRDFMPTREADMIHYMELLAVAEASNRRLLPPRYRNIDVAELNGELRRAAEKTRRS